MICPILHLKPITILQYIRTVRTDFYKNSSYPNMVYLVQNVPIVYNCKIKIVFLILNTF